MATQNEHMHQNGVGIEQAHSGILNKVPNYEENGTAENVAGILHVTIHHATDIHNICIYGNQDVYAKFSVASCEDVVYSTQPVKAGGKNPVFNQTLQIPLSQPDAVLRCEIWMMSCARDYLEDQLLGFVLVPLKDLCGKGKYTQDYCLTSTDLFYTPAGTVCLSLLLHKNGSDTELSMFQENGAEWMHCRHHEGTTDLRSVEFPDLQVASENQHLVSIYLSNLAADHVNEPDSVVAYKSNAVEEEADTTVDEHNEMLYPKGKKVVGSSSSLMDDCSKCASDGYLNNGDILENIVLEEANCARVPHVQESHVSSDDPQSKEDCHLPSPSAAGQSSTNEHNITRGRALADSPFVSISLGVEAAVDQDHIVDLYMKSMQQFTEKLAEMKFSLNAEPQDPKMDKTNMETEVSDAHKEEGTRLYYGSRAFF